MNLIERAKNICITPKTEWPVIAQETTPTAALITGYVLPLAAIGAIGGFVGGSIIGHSMPFLGNFRVPIVAGVGLAVFQLVMAVIGVFVISFIINALAPSFGAEKNNQQALKVGVYSYTPAWVAGVFYMIPGLGILAFLAGLYGLYLLYLGLLELMKTPADKAIGYTVVVVICAIVFSIMISAVGALFGGVGMMGSGMMGAMQGHDTPAIKFDKDSPMGKLEQFGKKMEESGKKMEAAQKSGDEKAQMTAAMEGLGTLLGGGKRVEPIGIEQLKPFVPDTFAGLPKKSSQAEKTGVAAFMVSKAEATYGDGAQKNVSLEISDSGGASGMLGLAGWASIQGEKESDSGSEKTYKANGRMVHEKSSKTGGRNEFAVVLGDRFIVTARGRGVDVNELKSAVSALDLAKLESMKDVGVQQ